MSEKETGKKKSKKIKNIELLQTELQMYEQMPDQIMVVKGWTPKELQENIDELRSKIELSKRGKSSRTKGARYENVVAKKIGEKWKIHLVRTPMSGGFQKSSDNEDIRGDLSCLDKDTKFLLSPECKKHQTWKLREWFDQAKDDTPVGKIPLVVYHDFQKIKEGKRVREADDFVMIRLDDFLDIVDTNKVIIRGGAKRDEQTKPESKISRKTIKGIKRRARKTQQE